MCYNNHKMNKRGVGVRSRLFGILLVGGIVAAGFCLMGINIENTAKALDLAVSTPEDPILEVSLSSNLVQLDLAPTGGTAFSSADLTVTAGTNNLYGYKLYMEAGSTSLTRTESLANNTTPTIPSLAVNEQGYTEANFTANSWGYQLGGGNYFAIPGGSILLNSSEGPTNADSTTITFASKVNMAQAAGSYSTDITIRGVADIPAPSMQNIDMWRGSLTEDQSIQVQDERDGKEYWVLKARDGHIWMTQNLDLDLDSTKTYTPADTDITANWTPSRTTKAFSTDYFSGWITDYTGPFSVDPGEWYYIDTWYPNNDCPSTEGNAYIGCTYLSGNVGGKFKQTPYSGNGTHGHVGNYYNWSAAVAMNDTSGYTASTYDNPNNSPQTSICPAGWRLPTVSSVTGRNDFQSLFTAYNIGWNSGDQNYVAAPLYFPRSGVVYDWMGAGHLYRGGESVSYWTNTVYSNERAYGVFDYAGNIQVINGAKFGADPVRCVARNPRATIVFDANGGVGTMPTQTISEYGGTLNMNTFTRDGYIFNGWNTAADGSGEQYSNGASYSGLSTTLYAQWIEGRSMQKVSEWKNNLAINDPVYATDERDGKNYQITKLSDGLVWMTQNLDIAGGTTLVPETSNVTRSYTLPNSTLTGFDNNTTAYVYNTNDSGYYSYVAATAGINPSSGNTTEDICPAGWKLPTQANYNTLLGLYNSGGTLTLAPWNGVYGGYIHQSTLDLVGSYGLYWSATADGSNAPNYAFPLRLNQSAGNTNTLLASKLGGCNVRCIAK